MAAVVKRLALAEKAPLGLCSLVPSGQDPSTVVLTPQVGFWYDLSGSVLTNSSSRTLVNCQYFASSKTALTSLLRSYFMRVMLEGMGVAFHPGSIPALYITA